MKGGEWRRDEVEAIVDDHLAMLAAELSGTPYSKAAHRRALLPRLAGRSAQSVEFKHANISAALLDAGLPYIDGYKPRFNYQGLVAEVLAGRLAGMPRLLELVAADADRAAAVPEVEDILAVLAEPPAPLPGTPAARDAARPALRAPADYLEREARNRSLGAAGELFVLGYERARLVRAGREALAARIEHTSRVRGDHEGYDILSFEESGAERLIEVKTTKHGSHTPFFATSNEVLVSGRRAPSYRLYRLYAFRRAPRLCTLAGALGETCRLSAATFRALPR